MNNLISQLVLVYFLVCINKVYSSWTPALPSISSNAVDANQLINSYSKCDVVYSGTPSSQHILLYHKTPKTIVISIPGFESGARGVMDVRTVGELFHFDYPLNGVECLIIPPYQPLDWIMLDYRAQLSVCAYSDSITEDEVGTAGDCACSAAIKNPNACQVMTPPRTIRKPEHEFFLTAEITPDIKDVSITTILTVDRLIRLDQMSQMWGGPISATVYLHELTEMDALITAYMQSPSMRKHVDVHLVIDDKIVAMRLPDRPFPINILRNVAVRFARTAFVMYIEGDFIPSPDLYYNLEEVKARLSKGEKSVFIVAPFGTQNVNYPMSEFPKNKQELLELVQKPGKIMESLAYFQSHASFKFDEWFKSTKIYQMGYVGGYEPYYIGPKTYPLFDETFIGCGADKVSHPTELNAAGYQFFVVPHGFIVHIDSTGMGSAWCRGWAGDRRSSLKWEQFSKKNEHRYSHRLQPPNWPSEWWNAIPGSGLPLPDLEVTVFGTKKEGDETCAIDTKPLNEAVIAELQEERELALATINEMKEELTKLKDDNRRLSIEKDTTLIELDDFKKHSSLLTNILFCTLLVFVLAFLWCCCGSKKRVALPIWKSSSKTRDRIL
eukprot:TRINITY_DN1874_c0_g1_i1.p1 TRINITY_DN1874_c0_g1~~TRINITY_DN1874_c0_g1_i1.p1  ORF type:complete len:610 (-),score=89.05 TRINITY_DN1874_c0_g1_i1:73-1902(-)